MLAVATVHFLAWVAATPALQVPDETAHFAYVQRLVEHGDRPPAEGPGTPASTEVDLAAREAGLLPLRGNAAARETWTSLDRARWDAIDRRLTEDDRSDGLGANTAARNLPLYYAYEAIPYAVGRGLSFFDRLTVMRLANLPLYLLTIVLTWLVAGRLLGPRRGPQTLATLCVALLPQFAFIAAGVAPDVLLAAIGAAYLLVTVMLLQGGRSRVLIPVLVALALASAATHTRGTALLLVTPLVIGLSLVRGRRWDGRAIALCAAGAALTLVLGVVAAIRFADVLYPAHAPAFSVREFLSYGWQFYLPRLPSMTPMIGPDYGFREVYVESFYGAFGWLEVRFPGWVYDVLRLLSVAGAVALVVLAIVRRGALRARGTLFAALAAIALLLVASLHYGAYGNLKLDPGDPIIVGRYLFPLLPLFGCAIAVLTDALPRRAGVVVGSAVVAGGVLLATAGLGLTVTRFYA